MTAQRSRHGSALRLARANGGDAYAQCTARVPGGVPTLGWCDGERGLIVRCRAGCDPREVLG